MKLVLSILFQIYFVFGCEHLVENKMEAREGTQVPEKTGGAIPKYEALQDEFICEERLQLALNMGCISNSQAGALRFMHAAPVCNTEGNLIRWEQCDHKTLKSISDLLSKGVKCTSNKFIQGNCDYEFAGFAPKNGRNQSVGSRILVIDSGLRALSYLRFKSRVLDFLDPNPFGNFVTTRKLIAVPADLKKIWSKLLDENDPYLLSRTLQNVGLQFYDTFSATREVPLGHGGPILVALAELLPNAEFVIADYDERKITPYGFYCGDISDRDTIDNIKKFVSNLSASLMKAIERHQINYINLSSGHTLENLKKDVQQNCNGNLPSEQKLRTIFKIWLDHFYTPLSSIDGVVLVQAGVPSVEKLTINDPDFLTDCTPLPNRIRIGSYSKDGYSVPAEGSNEWHFLSQASYNALSCIDLFIAGPEKNISKRFLDFRDYQKAIWLSFTALEGGPMWPLMSSWAAPIALAYLVKLRENMPASTTVTDLIAAATNHGHGRLKDPARYELYPLNLYADLNDLDGH